MELPELSSRLGIIEHKAHSTKCFDMILGRDSLQELGVKLDFEDNLVTCQHVKKVPMGTIQQVSSEQESHFF
jgi:hypothetical protein